MAEPLALIAAWARSAVAPHGGAFRTFAAHDIGAPVLQALLQRAGYHRPVDVVGYQGQAYALFDSGRWEAVEVLRWLKEYVEEAQRQRV